MKALIGLLAFCFLVSACGSKNRVVFITKTSLSILEADSKPAGVSIAYDRVEGYIGPKYDNGAVPPVYAAIESNGKIFNPRVKQLYATGRAAVIATALNAKDVPPPEDKLLAGRKKVMFFGTATTTGLKVGVTTTVPDSFVFGYRRKEFSVIPLGATIDENSGELVDNYPSVLASIQTKADVGENPLSGDVGLANKQFFATGVAAEHLAVELAPVFLERAKNAVGNPGVLGACYARVAYELRPNVWKDASDDNLLHEPEGERGDIYKKLMTAYTEALSDPQKIDINRLARVDGAYLQNVRISGGLDAPLRSKRLQKHNEFVCSLAKLNNAS